MNAIEITGAILFGIIWGSFFFTLALRFISGEIADNAKRALFSSSKCPNCGEKISIIFLVPIIGYMIQMGKCCKCGSRISILYPLSEIFFGILLLITAQHYGITIYAFNIFLLAGIAITIAVIDLKTMTIPDSLVITFLILSIYPVVLNWSIIDNLLGLLIMGGFFITILLIFPGSFGGGDIKFAAAIGLLSGWEQSIVILETSLITGAVTGIIYALKSRKILKAKIPFGPFLTIGLLLSFFYGREIILIYFSILN